MKHLMIKKVKKFVLFSAVLIGAVFSFSPIHKQAYACDWCIDAMIQALPEEWLQDTSGGGAAGGSGSGPTVPVINDHVTAEFEEHRTWIVSLLWEDNILPAMMLMAEQLTAVAMHQVLIIGAMLDAKHQLETQRLLQQLQAQAHKDYHPSIGMCEFGSAAKSLAASERKSEYNSILMSQRSMDRQLGNANSSAMYGNDLDKESRLNQFKAKFCDPKDNNNGLGYMCEAPGADKNRYNKDIDYTRTVDYPWTLDIDFTNGGTPTEHEEEVFALANNLYAHHVFARPSGKLLEPLPDGTLTNLQKKYLDMRSIVAKRSVAENSFNAITAMKAQGLPESRDFLIAMLDDLGVVDANTIDLIGENPSYYAQMEMLTKKIYQNPDFYTNLYDKPVNVERKGVSMQAIALMQKFDMFKSYLRSEASLSILLELAVMDLQDEIENEINPLAGVGELAQ
ncbi:MAG: hypothetical protein DHS20C02_14950 [Micavibrio sp.]|nr:MAG: hypothetical protein DHS20C02_14950 [Micavibrio sp.]